MNKKKRRFWVNLRNRKMVIAKGVSIIPHLFTLGNAFFGFMSIILASQFSFEAAAYLLRQGARKSTSPVRQQEEVPRRDFTSSTHPETPQAPPDWLKPKIYKGSQLL